MTARTIDSHIGRIVRSVPPLLFATLLTGLMAPGTRAQEMRRAMTPTDLWSMGRVGAPVISPDGQRVAYTITRYDIDANRGHTDIWVVPIAGGEPQQLTASPDGSSSSPAWSPDGQWLAFISSRGGDGAQLYLLPTTGGEAHQVTHLKGGAAGAVWSADGKEILVASQVWPKGDPDAERLERLAEGKSSARIYDHLMYRHWDEWEDGMRSHVFLVDVATDSARDLTPGPYDTPPLALGGFQDYDLSPDGSELAFVRNTDVPTAVGTGNDIWLVSTSGGEPHKLTTNPANDVSPQYSPDGRMIAYLATRRAGFESDRTRLVVYDRQTGEQHWITEGFDRSVDDFAWSRDSHTLYFTAQNELFHPVYRVPVDGDVVTRITEGHNDGAFAVTPDESTLVVARQATDLPTELFAIHSRGQNAVQLTHTNQSLLAELAVQPAEPFWFAGAAGAQVEGFLVKPPAFDPAKKYPVLLLVHGGPQGAWTDQFHYRWNTNLFAAPGYVVVAINPRGSTGYGQLFTDQISGDWGGAVYQDLMKGLDYALVHYRFLDGDNMAAAGGSYGGYMMNWLEGHTTRFKTLINHDGVYNTVSMYGATEELWFPEWEFHGTPWSNPQLYTKWNNANFVKNFRTPMLIIHGGRDYRVPLEQGLQVFTALRRNGIRARLLYFPDEGHWVLQPQNALVWWDTIHQWLAEYLGPTT